ncbi:MAG TPA: thioesterase family protein [Aggregatilineaceae bacterium]|nr:thioesterase family protein [Aggregatilineaceae bacterium]
MAPTDRFVSENTFRVRYAETDAMGITHHANYIIYFEEARSHYSRVRGASYADFERSGYWLTVVEVHARYIVPTRYSQLITARCWIEDLKSRTVTFGYEIVDAGTGKVCVTGYSRHICINHDGQVCKIPESWRATIERDAPGAN